MNLDERFGGLTSSLPHFCNAVTQSGRLTAKLAAFCNEDEVSPPLLPADALYRLPAGRLRWAMDSELHRSLGALIQEAAIVHIHGLWTEHSFLTARLCRRLGKPYVVSAHGMLEPWALNNRKWKKRAYLAAVEGKVLRGAAGLRALTQAEVSDYRNLGLRNPVTVLPNGIDLHDASPRLFLEQFPQLAGRRLILFLGRIHPKKGVDILCRAWARVQERFPDAELVIAGPDEEGTLAGTRGLVTDLRMDGRVVFTGMLRGAVKWSALAAASLFVLPSHSEGFSVAILEALGSGVPVIISPACHFPEIVNANCGWEANPDDQQLAETLTAALSIGTARLAEMGRNGIRFVAGEFAWPRVGEQAADMLQTYLGSAGIRTLQTLP